MTTTLSAHDILRFRRGYARWEVDQVFLRDVELFHLELIEEHPADPVRWALWRADGRAVLSKRGARTHVPASLFAEVVATHRTAIVACVERELAGAVIDVQAALIRARVIRAAIAIVKGGPVTR